MANIFLSNIQSNNIPIKMLACVILSPALSGPYDHMSKLAQLYHPHFTVWRSSGCGSTSLLPRKDPAEGHATDQQTASHYQLLRSGLSGQDPPHLRHTLLRGD